MGKLVVSSAVVCRHSRPQWFLVVEPGACVPASPPHVPCSTPLVCQEVSWGLGFGGEGHLITPAMAITRQGGVATDSDRSWGLEGSWALAGGRGKREEGNGRSKAESQGVRGGRASAAGSQEDRIPGRASRAASGPRGMPRACGEGCSPASQPTSGTRFSQPHRPEEAVPQH